MRGSTKYFAQIQVRIIKLFLLRGSILSVCFTDNGYDIPINNQQSRLE